MWVPGFAIGSWHFALMSLAAIILFRLANTFWLRQAVLLVFNVYFAILIVGNLTSLIALGVFCLAVYVISYVRFKFDRKWPKTATVAVIAAFWFFLFTVRDHELFGAFNPFHKTLIEIIGISYLVFRSISYYFDFESLERRDFVSFLNYLLYFPSILSGPIARQEDFIRSVETPVPMSFDRTLNALHRISRGMIKKFVISDSFAYLTPSPENLMSLSLPMLWLGTMLSLFLLYLDLGGYCDIVIGIAELMGCHLPENFNHPFRARNIQEFWNRWHVSLSSIVRDYFFTPLAKFCYKKFPKVSRIVLITIVYAFCLVLIAVWHGTTEAYLIYGLLHATAVISLQVLRHLRHKKAVTSFGQNEKSESPVMDFIASAATYTFVTFTVTLTEFSGEKIWVFIRHLLAL